MKKSSIRHGICISPEKQCSTPKVQDELYSFHVQLLTSLSFLLPFLAFLNPNL